MHKIKHIKLLSIAVALILVFSVVFPLSTRAENESTDTFIAEQTINGTKVTVSADPEVFPEGTTLEVKEVNLTPKEDTLVASQQQADQKSIKKMALDITMKNKEGQEIEPDTSKGKVHVSFTNDDIKNHTTHVYHIDDDLNVESLKFTKSDNTVTSETKSFSTYVIDFTYDGNKIYYLYDNNTVDASTLLKTILGNNEAIEEDKISNVVSDKTYVTASNTSGKWQVAADPNTTEDVSHPATITITYYDVEYTISLSYKKTDSNWIKNFNYQTQGNTVLLKKFIGNTEVLNIYPTAYINGKTYRVKIWEDEEDPNNPNKVIRGLFQVASNQKEPSRLKEVNFIAGGIDSSTGKREGVLATSSALMNLFKDNTSITKVDLSGFDITGTTDASSMFSGCTNLTNIIFSQGDISLFNTSSIKNMARMFSNTHLSSLDLSTFDTTNLSDTSYLAADNEYLKEINLSSFKGAKAILGWMNYYLLSGSDAVEKITLGKDWVPSDGFQYYKLGIDGNWQNVQTSIVYTNEEIEESFTSSMAGTYIKTNLPPTSINQALYVADGYQKEQNMWEVHTPQEKFRAYCLDHQRLPPSGYFDKIEIDVNATEATKKTNEKGYSNYIMDYLDAGNTGYREIAPNMAKALVALIYYSDFSGNKGYNQNDIWHFTNDYSSGISASLQAKIDGKNSDGTSIGKKRTYESIGKEYKLFIYVPSEYNTSPDKNKMQNLLSIEGANDQTYAGVQVKKVDNKSNGLFGAKFKVTKKDGTDIIEGKKSLEFTTNAVGLGGIYRMDRTSGLTVGDYYLEEIEAPTGYELNDKKYEFSVTEDDDQKIVSVGDTNKVIVNNPKSTWHGGGLTLKKVDSNTGAGLNGAVFTLYLVNEDNSRTEVKKYTTDASGVLYTGNKELEIGKKYIIEETTAPDGYVNEHFSKEITLTSSYENKYFELGSITNNAKKGSVTLTAKKILKNANGTLKAGQFTFQLYDSSQNPIGNPKANVEDGTITFDPLNFTAADMPGKTFYIKEVIPETNKDNELEYDTHEERVQIFISDDGTDTLQCKVQTDSDGITFVNTSKVNYNGKLTVKKIVKDALEENDSFNFYVYLTSDSADLDKKTFNYTLDGKSGTFTLNKAGTRDGKFRYRSQQAFKLSNNSVLEMSKLPVGARYEVTEDDYKSEGYVTTKTDNYQGDVSLEGAEVTFTNTRNQIIPTGADTMTHMSFWLIASAVAIVLVLILKRKLKASKK